MDGEHDAEKAMPKKRRLGVKWRRDLVILERLPKVERLHLKGQPNTRIAAALGVSEKTIRLDIERIKELWLERTGESIEALRAKAVAELEDIRVRALEAAEWDQMCEQAVLFDDVEEENVVMLQTGKPAKRSVQRDDKGSATFRGQKAASLAVARQASVDKAKLQGLVTEKPEAGVTVIIREYGVSTEAV
jgi:hypothetical protein